MNDLELFEYIEYLSYLSWNFGWDEDDPAPESGDSDGDGPIVMDPDDENEL